MESFPRTFLVGALTATVLLGSVAGGMAVWERLTCGTRLLNVSYDPTREMWKEVNAAFVEQHPLAAGRLMRTSHGGSTSQARAVLDGLEADIVSLALWSDVDGLRQGGLVAAGWEERYPPPFHSTVVFLVRKGNPHGIRDWPDLLKDGVQIITPNPKTSGNGRMSLLAAWGAIQTAPGGSEEKARAFVAEMYRRVPVLDTGARNATLTFSQKKVGDVQIAWENEAFLQLREFPDELEMVYPSRSIRAEPPVALVDRTVDRKGTREVAQAFLDFLKEEPTQEILARHHYRPTHPEVWARYGEQFGPRGQKPMPLFGIDDFVPGGWSAAQEKFFGPGGEYDRLAR